MNNKTIQQLIDNGAHVTITYRSNDKQEALNRMLPIISTGNAQEYITADECWFQSSKAGVTMKSYYEEMGK